MNKSRTASCKEGLCFFFFFSPLYPQERWECVTFLKAHQSDDTRAIKKIRVHKTVFYWVMLSFKRYLRKHHHHQWKCVCSEWFFFLYFRKQWSITLGGPRWRPLNPPKLAVFATSFTDLAYLSLLPFSLAKADKVPYNVTPPPSPKLLPPPPVGAWCYQTSGI